MSTHFADRGDVLVRILPLQRRSARLSRLADSHIGRAGDALTRTVGVSNYMRRAREARLHRFPQGDDMRHCSRASGTPPHRIHGREPCCSGRMEIWHRSLTSGKQMPSSGRRVVRGWFARTSAHASIPFRESEMCNRVGLNWKAALVASGVARL
jgi:hypothetical protein